MSRETRPLGAGNGVSRYNRLWCDAPCGGVSRSGVRTPGAGPDGVPPLARSRDSPLPFPLPVVPQHAFGLYLQMGEVHRAPLFLEQLPVSHAAAPQCGDERTARIGQAPSGVDQLVADAVEIAGGLGRRVNPVPPSTLGDYVPAGAEYGVELLVQQQALFTLVQDLVIRLQPRQFSVGESSLCHRL